MDGYIEKAQVKVSSDDQKNDNIHILLTIRE